MTNFTNIDTGSTTVAYANTDTTEPLARDTFPDIATGHESTVLAVPALAAPDIGLIDAPFDKGLLSRSARVRTFNASANATNLDLYFVSPGSDINAVSPNMVGVSFKNAVPPSGKDSIYVSGGTYVLIATRAAARRRSSSRLRSISQTTPTGRSQRCRSAAS